MAEYLDLVQWAIIDLAGAFVDREKMMDKLDEMWAPRVKLTVETWGTDAEAIRAGRAMMDFVGSPDPAELERLAQEHEARRRDAGR